jgi:hypothetical protein
LDIGTTAFLTVVTILAANQAFARFPAARRFVVGFWLMQMGNVGLSLYALFIGLPGFDHAPAINWVVGLLVLFHVAHNLSLRTEDLRKQNVDPEKEEKAAALRSALHADEE